MSVVLVTGAASGIGRRLAEQLVARGDQVLAVDLDEKGLAVLASMCPGMEARRMDVTSFEDWEAAVGLALSRWGRLDVLLNVAGYLRPGWVHEVSPADMERHLDVNARGVMLGTRAASHVMVSRGRGHIVNVASMAALAPIPGIALYSASKYAVRGFSLAAALELRPRGVYVTVVCPDAVRTPMLDLQMDYAEAAMTFSAPRILTVDEVARAVLGPVLTRRPLEYWVPWSRGWVARLGDVMPGLMLHLQPLLARYGDWRRKRLYRNPTAGT